MRSNKMHRWISLIALSMVFMVATAQSCGTPSSEKETARVVEQQQSHYTNTQPIPFFDFSLQRDVYTQVYMATNEARNTYTIVESITGETKFHCPSVGYGIPADVSLTNPIQYYARRIDHPVTLEQAEPNGLYSSNNTDGTWIMCVVAGGDVTPIYTEHKVTTFPFVVRRGADGVWSAVAGSVPSTTVNVRGR